jgi:hypothetical protein
MKNIVIVEKACIDGSQCRFLNDDDDGNYISRDFQKNLHQ